MRTHENAAKFRRNASRYVDAFHRFECLRCGYTVPGGHPTLCATCLELEETETRNLERAQ